MKNDAAGLLAGTRKQQQSLFQSCQASRLSDSLQVESRRRNLYQNLETLVARASRGGVMNVARPLQWMGRSHRFPGCSKYEDR